MFADGVVVFVGTDFRTTVGDGVSTFAGTLAGVFFTSLGVDVADVAVLRRDEVLESVEIWLLEGDVKIRRETCGTSSTVGADWLGSTIPGPTRRLLRETDRGSGRVPTEVLRVATSLVELLILRGVEVAIGGGFGKSAGVAGDRRTILG